MSVAGLKKQFHKATQVRRGAGAPRGGPGRSRKGRARRWQSPGSGSGDPGPPAAPRPQRPPRPPRHLGAGNRPWAPHPQLGAGCWLRAPVGASRAASAAPRAGTPAAPQERRCLLAGGYVKSPISPVTLRYRCTRRPGSCWHDRRPRQGSCGDARGVFPLWSLNHSFHGPAGSGARGWGSFCTAQALSFPWGTWLSNSLEAKA